MPDPELESSAAPSFDDTADLVRRHKASLFPSVGLNYAEPIELRWGERQYVYDGAGREYLDFFGGIATVSSGHAIPEINDPIKAQLDRITHTSTLFLISYLTYHAQVGSVHFTGTGRARTLYFAILISHTILAALVAPLAVTTFVLARRGRFETHRRFARVTLPIWLYVSVTGVVIYTMLYQVRWS